MTEAEARALMQDVEDALIRYLSAEEVTSTDPNNPRNKRARKLEREYCVLVDKAVEQMTGGN